tara:strand:+ start:769 stop:993 length:225 start_codon:yes stop_codon:yes gene_type:complete
MQEKDINKIGRQVAIRLDYLMAEVDFKYNRHQKCLVCDEQYKHHEDGLPCLSDDNPKNIIRSTRWHGPKIIDTQ